MFQAIGLIFNQVCKWVGPLAKCVFSHPAINSIQPIFLFHSICQFFWHIGFVETKIYPSPNHSYHCGRCTTACTDTVKYRKQSSLNLNFALDLQFECWDDERIQFCQQYQLPHSSLIERHFEVLMLQIRGNSETSASDMSFKCPPCPLSKQCTFQTEETRKWSVGAMVPIVFKRQWSLSSLQSARVKDQRQ